MSPIQPSANKRVNGSFTFKQTRSLSSVAWPSARVTPIWGKNKNHMHEGGTKYWPKSMFCLLFKGDFAPMKGIINLFKIKNQMMATLLLKELRRRQQPVSTPAFGVKNI